VQTFLSQFLIQIIKKLCNNPGQLRLVQVRKLLRETVLYKKRQRMMEDRMMGAKKRAIYLTIKHLRERPYLIKSR
jgi:hypothetical protein